MTRASASGVARNSAAIVAAQVLGSVFRTLVTVLLIAVLVKEDYGALTVVLAFVDPFRSLAVLGMDTVAVRRAAADPSSIPRVVGTLLRIRIALALGAFAVACGAGVVLRADCPGGGFAAACAALGMLPAAVYGPMEVVFQARHRMSRLVLVPAAANAAAAAAVFFLWKAGASLPFFAAAMAAGDLVSAAAAWRLARTELQDESGAPASLSHDPALARTMLREGLPLAFVQVVVVLYSRAGIFLVEHFRGLGDVADLGAATRLSNPVLMVGSALAASVAPYATRLAEADARDEFRRFFRGFLVRALAWLVPCIAAACVAAPWIAATFRPEFASAVPAFRWLAFGALAMLVCQVSSSCLVGLGKFRAIAWFAALNLVVFLGLALFLVPRLGAEGAAISTLAMETLNAVLQSALVFSLVRPRTKAGADAAPPRTSGA